MIEAERAGKQRLLQMAKEYRFVFVMAAVGILLMLLPSFESEEEQEEYLTDAAKNSAYSLETIRQDLTSMLSAIEGVGEVQVMLTVRSNGRRIYQEDQELSYQGRAEDPEEYRSRKETVCLSHSGSEGALQTEEIYPEYLGALVVCSGADAAGTVLKVKEAVSVLTGLSGDRISVIKGTNFK